MWVHQMQSLTHVQPSQPTYDINQQPSAEARAAGKSVRKACGPKRPSSLLPSLLLGLPSMATAWLLATSMLDDMHAYNHAGVGVHELHEPDVP